MGNATTRRPSFGLTGLTAKRSAPARRLTRGIYAPNGASRPTSKRRTMTSAVKPYYCNACKTPQAGVRYNAVDAAGNAVLICLPCVSALRLLGKIKP